jgi:hypothetical protein
MFRKVALLSLLMLAALVPGHLLFAQEAADLSGVKTFLVDRATSLKQGADHLQQDADAYYALAQAANFDYAVLWANSKDEAVTLVQSLQNDWMTISPLYEQMEGIVAGVPSTTKYDPILDAGEKGDVPYSVFLPDGNVLAQPGNLFGLLETTLWGTDPEYVADVDADFDGNGSVDFGEALPDANLLKGFADATADQTGALLGQAVVWEPTETDVFTALVMNVPTMSAFFDSWKTSRFVMGDEATHNDFAVISRLSDIKDNVGSWQVMWSGLAPVVADSDAARNQQIATGLEDLHTYVTDLLDQENGGRRFTPEEADLFSSEAQDRATAIVGQIAQIAGEMNIVLPEE